MSAVFLLPPTRKSKLQVDSRPIAPSRESKFQVLTIVLIIVLTFVLTIDHSADHSADYGAGHSDCHGVDHCVDQGVDPAIETTVTLLSLLGQRRTPRGSASLELALCANFEH